ncbi:hypothetical protein RvY_15224 [Ramazzottius varieornatus]|uniref:Uncharacterized protein n=1 Tax=Ramazzottius varieornatus TaxID=947166 RepID=A0A1D1VVS9_RAMVA|nr:hypothetical protein RvY_15224 [Ramazzottius varieornatus]
MTVNRALAEQCGYGGGGWGGYYGGGFYPGGYVREPRQLQGYQPGYQPGGQTYQGDVAYRAPNWWTQDQQNNAQPIMLSWSEKCNDPFRRQVYRNDCLDDNGSGTWGRRKRR